MTSINKIYPFAQPAVPPNILDDADYSASTITTTTGYVEDTEADAPYMSKAQRQTSAMAAGLGQFIADNQTGTVDVTDNLSPATISAMIEDAASNAALGSITTQPQFDNSTKAATTAFVQRALGNLANSNVYAINTALTDADVGCIVVPTAGSLAFSLPLVGGLPNGAQIIFNGNTHGCVIGRQGSDIIAAGSSGNVITLSLNANDSAIFTVINGQWALTGGELHESVSSSFSASFATNGWAYVAGGRIEQWGLATFGAFAGAGTTITFPTPFPTACLNITATDIGPNANALSVDSVTTTNFVGRNGSLGSSTGYWRAIGH